MPASAPTVEPAGGRGFGVYIHWPFCLRKCPYCDFNSHVVRQIDQTAWRDALVEEIARYQAQLGPRRLDSIFFGGGTPSLMPVATVEAVLRAIDREWPIGPAMEITLEANPTSVEAENFAGLRAAGVNRLSLGIQSLDPAALKFLGREHDVDEALAALATAGRHFDRVSFDLIYARRGQTLAAWRAELERALTLAAGHLSLYQLTIEPGTAFHEQSERGANLISDDDVAAALYEATTELCAGAGYRAYEVSNYAQAGQESRHNLIYWRYGEYVGIGPGAHGRPIIDGRRRATAQIKAPGAWLAAVRDDGSGDGEVDVLPAETRAEEMLLMGLRLADGLDLDAFERECGRALADWPDWSGNLDRLIADDLLRLEQDRLLVPPFRRLLLNSILAALVAGPGHASA